ncbi:metallophosphoesterase [bacterium]|nr:metallophosphoesterase [bacterium]
MRRLTLPLLLVFLSAFVYAGTISGHVFLDANGDGQYQAGEPPAAGVLVSDGIAIVAPGADGAYQLQSPDGPQVVFVVNPTGTWPAAGFYRNVPTGAEQADFPLVRQEQKTPFYFVHGTDLHIQDSAAAQMAQYVKTLNELPVPLAFVVHTGDLAVDTTGCPLPEGERRLKLYQQMVAPLKMPLFNLPGNHEHAGAGSLDGPRTEPDWGKGIYRRLFGPMHYAFNYAGVGFIAMDGTDVSSGKVAYEIPQECMAWLKAYLPHVDMATPLVMMIHEEFFTLAQKPEVEQLLQGRKVIMALCGHGHSLSRVPFAGGMETEGGAVSYAWHGSSFAPNAMAYHLVKITPDGFEDVMGDWAERYPVTVVSPARSATLRDEAACDVRFLDLKSEVTSVDVSLGEAKQAVTDFRPDGLTRRFSCALKLPALVDGVHDFVLTLHGPGEPMVERQPFLVLTGREEPFAATAPAKLSMMLFGVQAANLVKVNGQEIGTLPADAKERQNFSLEVPATALRRLNTVEFVSAPLAAGGYDNFSALYVTMTYQGKKVSDPRNHGVTVPKSDQAVSRSLYFDIK